MVSLRIPKHISINTTKATFHCQRGCKEAELFPFSQINTVFLIAWWICMHTAQLKIFCFVFQIQCIKGLASKKYKEKHFSNAEIIVPLQHKNPKNKCTGFLSVWLTSDGKGLTEFVQLHYIKTLNCAASIVPQDSSPAL